MSMSFLRAAFLGCLAALLLSCGGGGGGAGGGGLAAGSGGLSAAGGDGVDGGAPGGAGIGSSNSTSAAGTGTTASSGDGSGVGSGGTGINTADGSGVGAVDGAGSIIVNGLRYNTDSAIFNVQDAPELLLGMTAKVTGPVNADFTSGIARQVDSAADVRGPISSIDLARGSFVVLGTTVTTDNATVWGDSTGLAAILSGSTVQVWGLPGAPGVLRATRVEQRGPSTPILTGTVQGLDPLRRTFTLGGVGIDFRSATLAGNLANMEIANGILVRVRLAAGGAGLLQATQVEGWYPVPLVDGMRVQLQGIVTDFSGLGTLRVLNVPVNAQSAAITGGPASSVGNGVKVEIAGVASNGVVRASQLKIRHVPGTGGPSSFNLIGTIGSFNSPASFKVKGQPIDASGPGVVFLNGTAANLGSGVKVSVEGSQVVNGVLLATNVVFD